MQYLRIVGLGLAILLVMLFSFPKNSLTTANTGAVLELTYPSNPLSGGTGFVVKTPSGSLYTMTNRHICKGAENGVVRARLDKNERYVNLHIIEISEEADLCLLTAFPNAKYLEIGQSVTWGQEVMLMGHPLLLPLTRTKGEIYEEQLITLVVAANVPDIETICQLEKGTVSTEMTFFGLIKICTRDYWSNRTSVTSYPGNSGSPIVDLDGKVVSVLFAGDRRTNWGAGVPLIDIKKFLSIY